MSDLRHSIRILSKRPRFTALVVASLSLGLAINTTIFTVVNSLLLQPLPYARPSELVEVSHVPGNVVLATLASAHSFSGVAAFTTANLPVGPDGDVKPVLGLRSSSNLFAVLGVAASVGRVFSSEDDKGGSPPVVVLSHDYWQQISGDPKVLGQTLTIESRHYTIVGVLPSSFSLSNRNANFWIISSGPLSRIVARLAPGVTSSQAESEARAIVRGFAPQNTHLSPDQEVLVRAASQAFRAGSNDTQTVMLLQGCALFVLMITAANVGGLILIQSSVRRKEFAIRTAVGAGRVQVLAQVLAESAVLTALGAGVGVILSRVSLDFIASRLPAGIFARLLAPDRLVIDYRVLTFIGGLALLTIMITSSAAAITSWRIEVSAALKGSSSQTGHRRPILGQALVSCEIALATMLLIGAGLIYKGLLGLENASLGFDPHNVIRARFEPVAARYPRPEQRIAAFDEVIRSLEDIPGVEAAGGISPQVFPFSGAVTPTSQFEIQGNLDFDVRADVFAVSPHYFQSVRLPLLAGRILSEADALNAPPVIVISRAFAVRYWGQRNPIGERIRLNRPDTPWVSIVGVVDDVRNAAGLERQRIVYRSIAQAAPAGIAIMIRTASGMSVADTVRKRLIAVDLTVPQYPIVDLESAVIAYRDPQTFTAGMWGSFAGFGLLLAAVGVYGMIRSWVTAHIAEIGVRLAIGAQPSHVVWLVLHRTLGSCVVGVLAGVLGAVGLRTVIASQLYGMSPADPVVFASVAGVITLTAWLAAAQPALWAVRIDPLTVLRQN